MSDKKEIGTPARPSILIDPVGAIFKARAEAAESLCLTMAVQLREQIATIAAQRVEIERLKAETGEDKPEDE